MAQEVQGVVHIASLFDESVAMCGARAGVLLSIGWETTPREDRCKACLNAVLKASASLQKWATP